MGGTSVMEQRTYQLLVPSRQRREQTAPPPPEPPRKRGRKAEPVGPIAPTPIPEVRIHEESNPIVSYIYQRLGSFYQILLMVSFVPFLVYFMLSWQHHVRSATVMLFSLENRNTAYITLGLISAMIRSFMVGNLLIGLFLGTASTIAFAILHLPFFYFIGFISGFLSLVPYLGVVLAMVVRPPVLVEHAILRQRSAP